MEQLNQAVSNPIAVVDLGEGEAWWEPRLLLLLSAASRLNRPCAVVFVATCHQRPHQFLGWGEPADLFRHMLAMVDAPLAHAYWEGRARAMQYRPQSGSDGVVPASTTRPLIPEALLMSSLVPIENSSDTARLISIGRLEHLVGPALHVTRIEDAASTQDKLTALLATTDAYLPVVDRGRYITVIPREQGINAVLRGIVRATRTNG